ncbi:ATP-grasp domain-containing protein [Kitasatospora sp. CM 4170]|uniref:ATP-grasp domain-containing protein n=1 Tax=Kitasatospora aburaviensis TaxID=67265 RepID=A0ABW1EQU0_9ACTN|nr:ATP-grasp domain-containing protein [Kitasatospora sp. CM 4170]WNM48415.1 ATP-grasp domain-containing protein [Kitasatospora sp. CM 4170]
MTAQDLVLFLGNARYGEFEPLRDAGYRVGLIRDVRSHGWCADDEAFDVVVPWDPTEGVEPLAARLGEEPGVCVLNLREAYVEPYARLLTVLGLPALPEEEVAGLRSKELMRRLFTERIGADSTGRFGPAGSVQDVLDFGEAHGWPVVVKPAALYSSLFVLTVPGPEAAAETFEHIRRGVADHVRGKGLPERFTALQVEEFLAGSNHSVDLVVDREGTPWPSPVVDVLTGADLGGDDFHHFARFAPSLAGEEHRRTMADLAVAAVRAMGLRLCAAHVEFILTVKGPRLLEVGVRPGGHRARVLHQAHGISFMAAYAAVLRGERPDLEARFDRPFGIVTPFPRVTGVFTGLNGFDRVTALPTYARHSLYHAPGVIAGTAAEGHWQVLSAELTADGADDLQRDIEAVWEMADLVLTRPQGGAAERRRDRPHLLVIGGKDSGFRSMAGLDARITLLQQRANLSGLQRERADGLFVQEELDDAWARSLAELLHGAGAPFDAVVSFAEPHLLTAARIGESLGIAHNPVPAVERSRDKTRMRGLLAEHGLPSVRYRACGAAEEAAAFQRELDAPVIVKPADGSGSRGVTLARSPEEAAEAWRRAAAAGGAVIAEEFVTGRELSVETLTLDGKHELVAVTEKLTSGAPSFVETGHQLPAGLGTGAAQAVEGTVVALLDALGHRWGPAHTEVMLRSDGSPVVIETQTRFGGDQIWEMVELVTGVPLAAATAAGMLGLDGQVRRTPAGAAAAIRFFAHENAEVLAVDGIDAARGLPGVVTVKAAAEPGRRLGPLTGSGSRQGYVLAVGADREEAVTRAETAWRAVDFRLSPLTDGGARPTS